MTIDRQFATFNQHNNYLDFDMIANAEPLPQEQSLLPFPAASTQDTPIGRRSLDQRATQGLPKEKDSSGFSAKKLILIAAATLLGAGTAAFIYSRSSLADFEGCRRYFGREPNLLQPIDRVFCQNRQAAMTLSDFIGKDGDPSKLDPNLRNDDELMKRIIGFYDVDVNRVVNSLGEEIKSDPEKLLSLLEKPHWERRRDADNLYAEHLNLLDSIPYQNNRALCLRTISIYPRNHRFSLYNKLDPALKQDKEILDKLFSEKKWRSDKDWGRPDYAATLKSTPYTDDKKLCQWLIPRYPREDLSSLYSEISPDLQKDSEIRNLFSQHGLNVPGMITA